jgi:hypothetical protein
VPFCFERLSQGELEVGLGRKPHRLLSKSRCPPNLCNPILCCRQGWHRKPEPLSHCSFTLSLLVDLSQQYVYLCVSMGRDSGMCGMCVLEHVDCGEGGSSWSIFLYQKPLLRHDSA